MTIHYLTAKVRTLLVCAIMAVFASGGAYAQKAALKTNLVSDALLSPNLGLEVGLAPKWTLDISGSINDWRVNKHLWKHWLIQPEARYWFCDRFSGHFLGMHLLGGQYNIGNISGLPNFLGTKFSDLKDTRFQGWYAGAGIAYGYTFLLSKHWSLEAELGVGYAYTRYDRFPCTVCGSKIVSDKPHHYFGPTKLAINIVYDF